MSRDVDSCDRREPVTCHAGSGSAAGGVVCALGGIHSLAVGYLFVIRSEPCPQCFFVDLSDTGPRQRIEYFHPVRKLPAGEF